MALTGLTEASAAAALADPQRLRLLESPLGQFIPGAAGGTSAIVTRFAEVAEVLENDGVFQVGPVYAEAMARTVGVFVLGMDDGPNHARETGFMQSAVGRNDVQRIRTIVADEAAALLGDAHARGRLDVASGFAHKIALGMVAKYFGVTGPDPSTMGRWMRGIAWGVFLNVANDPHVAERAVKYAGLLNAYLDSEIADLRARFSQAGEVPDHFLGRLVLNERQHAVDPDAVRRNVAGLIIGSVDTTSKAIVHAIDQLLHRPTPLAMTQKAARADDDQTVAACAFEALRFNPNNPLVVRHCAKDFVLAAGTNRETRIAAGSKVYVSTLAAMFDASVVASPHEFRVDRPWDHYLHFGRGLHRCFGERFNRVTVPQAVKTLFRCSGVRPVPGPEGRIRYEGPFPDRLLVLIG
jgi:cytochrome P450